VIRRRLLALTGLVLGTGAAQAPPAELHKAIAPGTPGVVRTILTGDRIQEIPLRFLGVYRGAAGPGHDLYLVRLEGEEAERVGIAAGMSGSPVYVDGRVVGALSYRMGALPKEPVAGVTPIEDLLGAARFSRPAAPAPEGNVVPIATPLLVGGLLAAVWDYLEPHLSPFGLVQQSGGAPPRRRRRPRRIGWSPARRWARRSSAAISRLPRWGRWRGWTETASSPLATPSWGRAGWRCRCSRRRSCTRWQRWAAR
jgi:hypothetical protein